MHCALAVGAGIETDELQTVVVTATRQPRAVLEVAASVDAVAVRRDALGVNLSESLSFVPGLSIRDRQNYAQDAQLSIRGFGARSTFGIRGVRLLVDDIPATQPDGQGQISHFNLATSDRIEVLRGPYSALYGNSAGGVVQLHTADGAGRPSVAADAVIAADATRRFGVRSAGAIEQRGMDYNIGYSRFTTDGERGHSAAQRDSLQGKVGVAVNDHARLRVLFNWLRAPEAQDALGLTAAQFAADPWQSAPAAVQFNTRKSTSQRQVGAVLDVDAGDWGAWRGMLYAGTRSVQQFLAIPASAQADPRHSGGVVDLATDYGGGEARWSRNWTTRGGQASVIAGLTYDLLGQHRRGYENFAGSSLGVVGALRRDERDDVAAWDQYVQLEWPVAATLTATVGARHSRIHFESKDRYVRVGNPDDSGQADYAAITPVASLLWRVSPRISVYVANGQGFETPTITELAYRTDGRAGLNFDLAAARTVSSEAGIKWQGEERSHAELAIFDARSRRELVVATNSGGRSAYVNAGRTERRGAELSAGALLSDAWRWQLAYTALSATVRDGYLTCTAAPCLVPSVSVPAGSRIPGVAANQLAAVLQFIAAGGWQANIGAHWVSSVAANDVNDATAAAYGVADMSVSMTHDWTRVRLNAFVRLDNLFDRRYAGSVIVNDANGRFFEAGAGRTAMLGTTVSWR
jgi:iron complex outermembrane receptor protein